ncbi:hypothetical protein ACWDA3_38675 [Nonomuraea rubra]
MFDLIEVRGQISGAVAVRGCWVTQSAIESPLRLTMMVRGRCRLSPDGLDAPIDMEAGDGDGPPMEFTPEPGQYAVRVGARTARSTTSASAVTSTSTRPVRRC